MGIEHPVELRLVEGGGVERLRLLVSHLEQARVALLENSAQLLERGDAAVAQIPMRTEEAVVLEKADQQDAGENEVRRLRGEHFERLALPGFVVLDVDAGAELRPSNDGKPRDAARFSQPAVEARDVGAVAALFKARTGLN